MGLGAIKKRNFKELTGDVDLLQKRFEAIEKRIKSGVQDAEKNFGDILDAPRLNRTEIAKIKYTATEAQALIKVINEQMDSAMERAGIIKEEAESKLNNKKLTDFVRMAIIAGLKWRMREIGSIGKYVFMFYQIIKKSGVVKAEDLKPLETRFEKVDVDMDAIGEKVRETMRGKLRREGDEDDEDEDEDDEEDEDEDEEKGPRGPKDEKRGPMGPKDEKRGPKPMRKPMMKKRSMSAK